MSAFRRARRCHGSGRCNDCARRGANFTIRQYSVTIRQYSVTIRQYSVRARGGGTADRQFARAISGGVQPHRCRSAGALAFLPLKRIPLARAGDSRLRRVLLTTHRRENQGGGIKAICRAVIAYLDAFNNIEFAIPVHLNPAVRGLFERLRGAPAVSGRSATSLSATPRRYGASSSDCH